MEPGTGLIHCSWPTTFTVKIGLQDVSGLYGLKLMRQDGKTRFIPLIVIDDRPADILFQASVQTYEAYNSWGGESLYRDASGMLLSGYASKVSFDRPFDSGRGFGQMLNWEVSMSRFLERYGYDVTYATNVDVGTRGLTFMDRAGMFVSAGHDEYWSGDQRDAMERARDEGVPLAFFSSNTGYWKIRYEDRNDSGSPRTLVCYKGGGDPLGSAASGLFRGDAIRKPENRLLGVMYESWQLIPFPFIVADASRWLFDGTALRSGDFVSGIVGYEFDHRFDNGFEPANVALLGRSPVVDVSGKPGWSEAVSYRAPSGALVFAAGSIYWSRGLDPDAVPDRRVERMTANVFREALAIQIPRDLDDLAQPSPIPATMGPVPVVVSNAVRDVPAPSGLAFVPAGAGSLSGSLVIALPRLAQVAVVSPGSRQAVILAGDGVASTSAGYDGVPGLQARFKTPTGVATDRAGRIYIADPGAHVIRQIDADAVHTTTTLAGGLGISGTSDGPGNQARFRVPTAVALDPADSTLYVADTFNHRVRAVNLQAGTVTTIAGSSLGDRDGPGGTALLSYPTALAVAPDGRLFVIVTGSRKVKVILPDVAHTVLTLAGGAEGFADGPGPKARLLPQGGAAWAGTFLAISDAGNLRVRALLPGQDAASTQVYTLAFAGRFGSVDGAAFDSEIGLPTGIAAGPDGNVYIADGANGTIHVIVQSH